MKRREVIRAMLALSVPGALVGCGGGENDAGSTPVQPPPVSVEPTPMISSLAVDKAQYIKGEAPTVTAVFSGGGARLEPGNIAIESGVATKLPQGLSAETTLRLTVTSATKSTTRDLVVPVTTGLAKWSAALTKTRQGTARAKVACIGDSTTSGVGSNASSPTLDSRAKAYPAQLAALLTKANTRASADSLFGDGFEAANIGKFDPRITLGGSWAVSGTFVAGGRAYLDQLTTNSVLSFNPGAVTDSLDIYFVTYPGYADFVVSTKGTYLGNGQTAGAQGIGKVTIKRPASDAPWDIQKSGLTADRALMLVGFDAYNSSTPDVAVWNMGASGSRVNHWAQGTDPYSFVNALPALAPDLSIINLTINDWYDSTPLDAYTAGLQKLIDAAKKTGDVLLVIGVPSNVETAPPERQQKYATAVRELAYKNNAPVVDLLTRWVSQTHNPMRGFYADGLHPSALGYADVAAAIAELIGAP